MGSLLRSRISLWAGLGGPWGRGEGGISFYMESRLMPSLLEESEYTPRAENVCVCACVFSDQSLAALPPICKQGGQRGKRKKRPAMVSPSI